MRCNNLSSQFHLPLKQKQIAAVDSLPMDFQYLVIWGTKGKKTSRALLRCESGTSWEILQSSTIICWSQMAKPFHIDSEQPIVPTLSDIHIHHKAPLIWSIFFKLTSLVNRFCKQAGPWVEWLSIRNTFSKLPLWPFVPRISWLAGIIRNIFSVCFLPLYL